MPETVLDAAELTRDFGRMRAVDGLSFSLRGGECLAVFGPNGAGKTTLLRLLAGLLRPTTGRASIGGSDVRADTGVRGRIGLISHQSMLYPALTAAENVAFAAQLHGVAGAREAAMRSLTTLGAAHVANTMVRTLSRGMQQRVSIARAIVHSPSVLLLDEPYTGLDANGSAALSAMLHDLRSAGATLVLVTHNIAEGLEAASHAAIMVQGRFARLEPVAGAEPATFAREYREFVGVRDMSASLVAG